MKALNTLFFYVGLIVLCISSWHRNDFSSNMMINPDALQEPNQNSAVDPPFSITIDTIQYRIEPLYNYDITGLVVSYQHHKGNFGLHALWNDHINVADICVIWDHNIRLVNLNAFDFWNGQFTCMFETNNMQEWKNFNLNQISNNHLLVEDSYLRKLINKVDIGDQIHISGWLVNYSNDKGFSRGTSTSRSDKGNGACETIFVHNFEILQSMTSRWRMTYYIALFVLFVSVVIWVIGVAKYKF